MQSKFFKTGLRKYRLQDIYIYNNGILFLVRENEEEEEEIEEERRGEDGDNKKEEE